MFQFYIKRLIDLPLWLISPLGSCVFNLTSKVWFPLFVPSTGRMCLQTYPSVSSWTPHFVNDGNMRWGLLNLILGRNWFWFLSISCKVVALYFVRSSFIWNSWKPVLTIGLPPKGVEHHRRDPATGLSGVRDAQIPKESRGEASYCLCLACMTMLLPIWHAVWFSLTPPILLHCRSKSNHQKMQQLKDIVRENLKDCCVHFYACYINPN